MPLLTAAVLARLKGMMAMRLTSVGFSLAMLVSSQPAEPVKKTATLTGWFADEGCAKGRVASGSIGPTNPECAKTCIDKGSPVVFISEQGKEMLYVKDFPADSAKENLGYHIEITGVANSAEKTISVATVKRLGDYQGPSCARPKKYR